MEYRYSQQIDPSSYDNQGLCDGISLRVHRNSDIDEAGTIRLRSDWRKYVGPLPLASHGGNMGPIYNFTSVAIPECRPDRLEVVSYIMELGFLHDDLVDISKVSEAGALNDQIMDGLNEGLGRGKLSGTKAGEKRILASLVEELMAIDPGRGVEVMNYWKRDLSTKRDRTEFKDFEDYLEYRVVDCGSFFLIALATFGMALTIPPEEKEECFRITRPVWAAAALTNDVQSWAKECNLVQMQDKTDMINGVWILMKQDSIDVDEAKRRVLEKVKEFVAEYVKTVKQIKSHRSLSLDSCRFIEAMQYMISGNLLWGISTPRYHPECTLNDMQIARLKSGWPYHASSDYKPQGVVSQTNGTDNIISNGIRNADPVLVLGLPDLPHTVINCPAKYLESLPSKNIRDTVADALNVWLDVAKDDEARIKRTINLLHNASLMLDDVQDGSSLRRGKPSAHSVFGVAQTVNSAGNQIIEAMDEVRRLNDVQCLDIFSEELRSLYLGQSYDLFWTSNIICPSIDQLLKMVDCKTGGLFRMLARLMIAKSRLPHKLEVTRFMALLGRYFQIRDDYMNLTSTEYTKQKGFCEDLDEGKFSLPLIHALKRIPEGEPGSLLLRNLLSQRLATGELSRAQKELVLELLQRAGSLEYTFQELGKLHLELMTEVDRIEVECGIGNKLLISLLGTLKVCK